MAKKREVKPAVKTTEFWMSLAANLVGAWQAVKPGNPYAQIAGTVLMSVATGGYAVSRGVAKAGAGEAPKAE